VVGVRWNGTGPAGPGPHRFWNQSRPINNNVTRAAHTLLTGKQAQQLLTTQHSKDMKVNVSSVMRAIANRTVVVGRGKHVTDEFKPAVKTNSVRVVVNNSTNLKPGTKAATGGPPPSGVKGTVQASAGNKGGNKGGGNGGGNAGNGGNGGKNNGKQQGGKAGNLRT
jgi:hypothetical protein